MIKTLLRLITNPVALAIVALLSSIYAGTAIAQSLTASVDRDTIYEDETLNLTVRFTGQTNMQAQPDFSDLSRDFEMLNQARSNRMTNYNGRVDSYTEWQIILAPRTPGTLLIPALRFQGQVSNPVPITVKVSQPMAPGAAKDVFIETVVDKSVAYVQEQVILKYRFFYSVNIDELGKEDLQFDNVVMENLEESRYGKVINGQQYQVVEFGYALFPQSSGLLEIPQLTWSARISRSPRRSIFDFNGGRFELKRIKTDVKTINIKEKPASFPPGATWLPSSALTLNESWASDPNRFKVGEPITRTLNLQANGLMASQLPEISTEPKDPRVKVYPDQPQLNDKLDTNGAIAQRLETSAVVVGEGGEITIPGARIPWWNIQTDTLEYAEIPERRFIVAADDSQQANRQARENAIAQSQELTRTATVTAEPTSTEKVVPVWLFVLLAALSVACVLLAFAWLHTQRQLRSLLNDSADNNARNLAKETREKALFNALKTQCVSGTPVEIRSATLSWAKAYWSRASIVSLSDVYRSSVDPDLKTQCLALDNTLFGGTSNGEENFDGQRFFAALDRLRKQSTQASANQPVLAPLYQ